MTIYLKLGWGEEGGSSRRIEAYCDILYLKWIFLA